jgi:hypothetical protein
VPAWRIGAGHLRDPEIEDLHVPALGHHEVTATDAGGNVAAVQFARASMTSGSCRSLKIAT